jgi:hypothetical protein
MSARVELGPPIGSYIQLDGPSEIARWFGALSWSRGSVYVTTFEQIQSLALASLSESVHIQRTSEIGQDSAEGVK